MDNNPHPIKTTYVDTDAELRRAVTELAVEPELAVDTESNSLFAYQERVCVIQIASPSDIFLFDTVRLTDLSPLARVFSSAKIRKYIHGADYDIGCMKRDFNFEFRNIFDTMIAAQFLNHPRIGMADLVEEICGVRLAKKFTRSNWAARPLSEGQLEYLCQDVEYLIRVGRHLDAQLKKADLTDEATIEFRRLEQRPPSEHIADNVTVWDVKGVRRLDPPRLVVFQELFDWRRTVARQRDLPTFKTINNPTLIAIAEAAPVDRPSLARVPGVSDFICRRWGDAILKAVRTGLDRARRGQRVPEPPRSQGKPWMRRQEELALAAIKEWRAAEANRRSLHAITILPNYAIDAILESKPRSIAALEKLPGVGKHRASVYGEKILSMVVGKSDKAEK